MDGIKNLSSPSRGNDWPRTARGDVPQERGASIAKKHILYFQPCSRGPQELHFRVCGLVRCNAVVIQAEMDCSYHSP